MIAARNRMLAEVSTPWLALHDADDVAYPHRLARAVDYINRYPESGMFYSLAEYYPACHRWTIPHNEEKPRRNSRSRAIWLFAAICNSTVIHNVERTRAVGGYRFNLNVEDCRPLVAYCASL